MSKRGYKLQEFVAHSARVNCLNIGKKACRHFITGGDDHQVNLWAIGKPTTLTSLCGHTSPIESLSFDSSEVLVLAGASSGMIKLWDLEEAKMVRTLTGHRSNCTAVEFHPFGEFCASGSMDTNLKIWDIKKKGCIHTYKGHTQGISTIKFTPDGRWVVSGGLDNVVKVWDLTAGKLLHDFKFHEGHVRSLAFHPLEFLLASGSADKTVKFWDLETFELIGSTRPEATGVRAITFHPDGRSLFSGLDESLKVYSWEPVMCHDTVDMGWSTLGDLCIHDGKLLSCSYYRNSVGVWVTDIALIEPYGSGASATPEQKDRMTLKSNVLTGSKSIISNKTSLKPSDLWSTPSDEIKEIKNIYVDTSDEKAIDTLPTKLLSSPLMVPQSDSMEISNPTSHKQNPAIRVMTKLNEKVLDKSMVVPVVVPRENSECGKDSTNLVREAVTFSRTKRGMLLKPAHIRKPSNGKTDLERLPEAVSSGILSQTSSDLDIISHSKFKTRTDSGATKESFDVNCSYMMSVEKKFDNILSPEISGIFSRAPSDLDIALDSNIKMRTDFDTAKESSHVKHSNIGSVEEKFDKSLSPEKSEQENCNDSVDNGKGISSVKHVNGVAVIQGRTRKLVDRFERREQTNCIESPATILPSCAFEEEPQITGNDMPSTNDSDAIEGLMQSHDVFLSSLRSRLTKLQVMRHFWERNDMKGAINAMTKLPDHSVQADVISVLIEKMDILTLDLFSCLLPVLVGLFDSKTERHVNITMEMLLKLVAVFGPVVRSTVLARPVVGVDLHAEERLKCCNQCSMQLQKIQRILPSLLTKGGLLARNSQELNLLLQQS